MEWIGLVEIRDYSEEVRKVDVSRDSGRSIVGRK